MAPANLVDVGSGRGTFLWPLLDAFPELPVTAIDHDPRRIADIEAVRTGGVTRLRAARMDAERLDFPNASADGVSMLEVLEHIARPEQAALEAVRVARRFVVVSVPSKADDNPEHVRLYDRPGLEDLLGAGGAHKVTVEYVLNHMIALAQV